MGAEAIKKILAEAVTMTVTIHHGDHDELHVAVGSTVEEAEKITRDVAGKAMKAGKAVTWENGTKEWLDWDVVWDSARGDFIWHEDGNRVRYKRVRSTMTADGEFKRKVLRTVWRLLDF